MGRAHPRQVGRAPAWPDPRDAELRIGTGAELLDDDGPCPFCEESRVRGAWFCRRCRRPVDPRAKSAIAAVSRARNAASTARAGVAPAVPTVRAPDPIAALNGNGHLPSSSPSTATPIDTRPAPVGPLLAAAIGTGADGPGPAAMNVAPDPGRSRSPREATVPGRARSVMRSRREHDPARAPSAVRQGAVAGPSGKPHPQARTNGHELLAPVRGGPARRAAATRPGASKSDDARQGRLDLNRATAEELVGLKGVGRVTAGRIVSAREDQPFGSVEALLERGVVGRSVLDRVRDQITV